MVVIDDHWLRRRGLLHDARLNVASMEGGTLTLSIDDEWSNEHDSKDKAQPGSIVINAYSVIQGDVSVSDGGWISEIEYDPDGSLRFDFCDRDRLRILAKWVTWTPG